ncbi:hypothetical protein BJ508DRAFT_362283 [Ascobolus immersus RN42]|uniref:Uncharacterized protein n=1 Tax=Ascobolus immersus RN42 TaxID=1160509 RepID=A0A3N4I486_ASCIM|nr:hypothetical protein BJ508DRAFT_362283 [Ascobolus immersus RN42]
MDGILFQNHHVPIPRADLIPSASTSQQPSPTAQISGLDEPHRHAFPSPRRRMLPVQFSIKPFSARHLTPKQDPELNSTWKLAPSLPPKQPDPLSTLRHTQKQPTRHH